MPAGTPWFGAALLEMAEAGAVLVSGRLLADRLHQQQNACMVSITIRDVPQEVRNELSARASRSGKSLQAYLRGELIDLAHRPDRTELLARWREDAVERGLRLTAEEIVASTSADRR